MKFIFTLSFASLFTLSGLAQTADGCDGFRYFYDVFDEVEKTTVQYGANVNVLGQNQPLYMDVYTPAGDQADHRPVIIWAFGGGFILGSREDVADACIGFARKGYVAAAIDYRLYSIFLGVPDSLTVIDVVTKAMHDMKASVRYFRQDAATTNTFRVDTNRMLVAGVSAGAITALHTAYLDADDNIPMYFQDVLDDNGGLEGSSGDAANLSYSSEVDFVVSLSGGLYKKEWMNAGEPPLVSIHGTADEVVPYEHGTAVVPINGQTYELVSLDGSALLHARADDLGIDNYLVSVPGGGHEDTYFDPQFEIYRDDFAVNGTFFVYERLCPDIPLLPLASTEVTLDAELLLFPNPASDHFVIDAGRIEETFTLEIVDAFGRTLQRWENIQGSATIYPQGLESGLYFAVCRFEDPALPAVTKRLVWQKP